MGKAVHNNNITIAKAIGIILMVIGHSGCPQVLFKFIYLFHMPLFFFCSGIFYKEVTSLNAATFFLKKRIKGLYVPFVKWSVLFLLLHNLFMIVGIYNPYYGYEGGSSSYTISDIFQKLFSILFTMHDYEEILGGFWFIRALFITSVLIAVFSLLLRMCSKFKYGLQCLLFLLLTILIRRIAPDPELWRDISMGTLGAFFYMSGNILMRYKSHWQNNYGTILCCFILFLSYFYFKDGISMGCGYNKVLPFSISALAGSILTISISNAIESRLAIVKRLLYYIGNHTLEILALHFLSFRLVSYMMVLFFGIDVVHVAEHPVIKDVIIPHSYWWIFYCVIGITLPLLLNWLWQITIVKIIRLG